MSDDIDFDQLIDLLDRALVSDDPKVKKALKKFLFITALATEDEETEGPLRNLIRRIEALEAKTAGGTYTWPSYPPGQIWYGSGPSGTGGGYFNGGSTAGGTVSCPSVWVNNPGDSNTPTITSFDNTSTTYTTTASSGVDTLIDDAMSDLDGLQKQASDHLQK